MQYMDFTANQQMHGIQYGGDLVNNNNRNPEPMAHQVAP